MVAIATPIRTIVEPIYAVDVNPSPIIITAMNTAITGVMNADKERITASMCLTNQK